MRTWGLWGGRVSPSPLHLSSIPLPFAFLSCPPWHLVTASYFQSGSCGNLSEACNVTSSLRALIESLRTKDVKRHLFRYEMLQRNQFPFVFRRWGRPFSYKALIQGDGRWASLGISLLTSFHKCGQTYPSHRGPVQ